MLAIFETHPVQYHAPVYQALSQMGARFRVIYASDFSVQGYRDQEFQADFRWDTDLLSGYESSFIQTVANGGASNYEEVPRHGVKEAYDRFSPSRVLCLGYSTPFDRAVIRNALRSSTPLWIRSEASDVAICRSPMKAFVRNWMLSRLYRRCEKLLYVGKNNFDHYRHLGVPTSKLAFSPYCVSTSAFEIDLQVRAEKRLKIRQTLGIQAETLCILFCGKLSKRKGVDLLLKAVKELEPSLRERLHILYVGDGTLRQELFMLANSDPSVRINITGFKNQHELSFYYHAADMAVLPSVYSETWGLVVNEALLHGVPCLVSDRVGCAPDLIDIGTTGEIFLSGNPNDLKLNLARLATYCRKPNLGLACQQKVAKYSVTQAAQGIFDLLNTSMPNRNARST